MLIFRGVYHFSKIFPKKTSAHLGLFFFETSKVTKVDHSHWRLCFCWLPFFRKHRWWWYLGGVDFHWKLYLCQLSQVDLEHPIFCRPWRINLQRLYIHEEKTSKRCLTSEFHAEKKKNKQTRRLWTCGLGGFVGIWLGKDIIFDYFRSISKTKCYPESAIQNYQMDPELSIDIP